MTPEDIPGKLIPDDLKLLFLLRSPTATEPRDQDLRKAA